MKPPEVIAGVGVVLLVAGGLAAWYFLMPAQDAVDAEPVSGGTSDNADTGISLLETDMPNTSEPRPVRDNNWSDLLYSPANNWRGQIGQEGGYCVFDTAHNGLRAAFINLHSYFKRGLNTIEKIVSSWAPPPGNPTQSYINFVAAQLNLRSDTVLGWRDMYTIPLMMAICTDEAGYQPGTRDDYQAAIDDTGY